MKIILADDHALFRDGFALLIKQTEDDSEVVTAGDLDAALALADQHPDADLLVLDLNMPGMEGCASVEAVMAAHPELPVVILSAVEDRTQMESLLATGLSGFIPKSSPSQVMLSAIRLIMAGGVYVPPQMIHAGQEAPVGEKPPRPKALSRLTERQEDVLRLLCAGKSNKLICRELGLGEGTVKAHIAAIFRVLDVNNRTEAAAAARHMGMVD